jgi:hypothetical protein
MATFTQASSKMIYAMVRELFGSGTASATQASSARTRKTGQVCIDGRTEVGTKDAGKRIKRLEKVCTIMRRDLAKKITTIQKE